MCCYLGVNEFEVCLLGGSEFGCVVNDEEIDVRIQEGRLCLPIQVVELFDRCLHWILVFIVEAY